MSNENIFEKASRKKIRFETTKGFITTEDLWDLPLTSVSNKPNLDDIAKNLYVKIKNSSENISFVVKETKENETNQLSFDIVKYIIDKKIAERDESETKRINKEKKERILELINKKEDENLLSSSLEDLKKMANSL